MSVQAWSACNIGQGPAEGASLLEKEAQVL